MDRLIVRSYVLRPYTMVKDLRTGVQTTDARRVLDGDIDQFLTAALALGHDDRKARAHAWLVAVRRKRT